jgi:excinuclease ABC subunit A
MSCWHTAGESFSAANFNVVIDRVAVQPDEDTKSRVADSVGTAFFEGHGACIIKIPGNDQKFTRVFTNRFEADGIEFEDPTVHTFSFNNPVGACPTCEGYGKVIGIDEDLVIPNKSLSVYQDAIACWKGEKMSEWKDKLVYSAEHFGFPIHKPWYELSEDQKSLVWTGNRYFKGLNRFFKHLEEKSYKIQYRVMLSRYRGKTTCHECRGTRLKKEAGYVKVADQSIQNLVLMPVSELQKFFHSMELPGHEKEIAKRILIEIISRLDFLCDVGLGYLTLNRLSSTLSGGESQRINLATSLGSSLVGRFIFWTNPASGFTPVTRAD